ncbi:cell division ATPase FtsA [Bradyrhizobium sp. GM2.4]
MTGLDRTQTPKTRPMPHKRGGLVACLDIGTSKIACMIARLKPSAPSEALRDRTHAVELIGYSQIQSRGMKAGAVIDLGECEQAVRQAVGLAEKMAKVRVESPCCCRSPAAGSPVSWSKLRPTSAAAP